MEEQFITTGELCEWLRVSRTTVWSWRQMGLPFTGTGKALRYRKSEVEEWLKSQQTKR